MCGIFGHTGLNTKNIEASHTALNTLEHRGPDGWHFSVVDDVYLGHRRLSIIDLSENSNQPLIANNVHLTANGEIYNYKELREELKKAHGATFQSEGDCEVLLQGYIHWGINGLLDKVDGMFALAIYDANKKKTFLARDHAGIKPLYYGFDGTKFSWASELKAIVQLNGKENLTIDNTAIYDFLTYLYIPCPKTLYQDVFKLKPGHLATFDNKSNTLEIEQYWALNPTIKKRRYGEAKHDVKYAISQSIKEQLVADVPVGFFLSGGVDSSIVCVEGSKLIEKNMFTCSISMDDPNVDETKYAKAVADAIGSNHLTRMASHDLINSKPNMMNDLFDEPFSDTSAFPTFEVCKLASENVTVVLTGDGGDELFGGYSSYQNKLFALTPFTGILAPIRPLLVYLKNNGKGRIQALARKFEVLAITNPLEKRSRLIGGLIKTDKQKQAWAKKLNIPDNYDEYWHTKQYLRYDLPWRTRAQYMDFNTYMHEQVLTKVDRTSMAVSIETRVPLLSKRMCETAFSIEEKHRFVHGELKGILKDMYRKILPEFILYRRKQGFSVGSTKRGDALHRLNNESYAEKLLSTFFDISLKN